MIPNKANRVICTSAGFFLLTISLSQTVRAKPNVWCEVGEWTGSTVLLASSFVIDTWRPLFRTPLIGGVTDRAYIDHEAVREAWLGGAAAGVLVGIVLVPNHSGFWNETGYRNAKGFYQAFSVNNFLTNVAKIVVGRKRPDYDDRVRSGRDTVYGRKSFWSGHASTSFCIASYASLFTFGQIGGNRKPLAVGAKTAFALGLHALAGYIAATRVAEHKHYPGDVIAGALVGSATALFCYGLQNGWWFHKNSDTGLRWQLSPGQLRITLTIPYRGYN